jgi:hypothetical protein
MVESCDGTENCRDGEIRSLLSASEMAGSHVAVAKLDTGKGP